MLMNTTMKTTMSLGPISAMVPSLESQAVLCLPCNQDFHRSGVRSLIVSLLLKFELEAVVPCVHKAKKNDAMSTVANLQ